MDDLSLPKFRPPISTHDTNGHRLSRAAVASCRRDVCGANRVDGKTDDSTGRLGRIAPGLVDACCALSAQIGAKDPSRPLLRNGADDRLKGNPFIQLFLFQRAMMNGKAAQLAI